MMQPTVTIGALSRSSWLSSRWAREVFLALTFNALLVVSAQVAIPLPFSPVPITLQTFGVLVAALALGRVRAVGVVALYLCEGAAGLPVFAGGVGGAQALVGPTGGYLLGFLASAALVGWLAERGWDRRYGLSLAALSLGTALIFACGLAWLSRFVPAEALVATGLAPFVPGAAVKIFAAFWLSPSLARVKRRAGV